MTYCNIYSGTESSRNTIFLEHGVVAYHKSECRICTLLEDQLKEVLDELSSSKLIIKLSYEEISSSKRTAVHVDISFGGGICEESTINNK